TDSSDVTQCARVGHGKRHRSAPFHFVAIELAGPTRSIPKTRGDGLMRYPISMSVVPKVAAFFDPETNTISYVAKDPASLSCAVIDSVMDIDYAAGRISYKSADAIIGYIQLNQLRVGWLIETHAHADHLSAAPYIQQRLGGKLGIGEHIVAVQKTF